MKIMYISVSLADVMLCFTKILDQKIKSKILIMFEEMGSIPWIHQSRLIENISGKKMKINLGISNQFLYDI